MEVKGTDTSLRINFMVSNNNYAMMYYLLRFFRLRSTHRITGSLNVPAYTFDDSTRAFASVRVGISSIEPIREANFQGNMTGFGVQDGCMPVNEQTAPLNREYLKLKLFYSSTFGRTGRTRGSSRRGRHYGGLSMTTFSLCTRSWVNTYNIHLFNIFVLEYSFYSVFFYLTR
ncbi:hypothetical protein EDC94DRAFT_607891 [Helicostylum pulchrum]|nr:hypothetical protein EDC94DRAFT_607891 [Helicostylum pulchrum]